MTNFTISRTYPTPDDAGLHMGPRERAMAVLKYLLNVEPEQAAGLPRRGIEPHPQYAMLVNAFENQRRLGAIELSKLPLLARLRQAFRIVLGRPLKEMLPPTGDPVAEQRDILGRLRPS